MNLRPSTCFVQIRYFDSFTCIWSLFTANERAVISSFSSLKQWTHMGHNVLETSDFVHFTLITSIIILSKYLMYSIKWIRTQFPKFIQCVPFATEPAISLIILPLMRILQRNLKRTYLIVSQQLGALQTHSFSFLTQRTYSCSNFVAISSLVLELLKKCRVR